MPAARLCMAWRVQAPLTSAVRAPSTASTVIFFAGLIIAIILHEVSHGVVAKLSRWTRPRRKAGPAHPEPHPRTSTRFGSIVIPVPRWRLTHLPVIGWAQTGAG